MRVHRIVCLVIDPNNDLPAQEYADMLEDCKYVNPTILKVESAEIGEWKDDNPLNRRETRDAEVTRLFDGGRLHAKQPDEDTCQTSQADAAEIERLTAELAKYKADTDGLIDRLTAAYNSDATVEPTDPPVTVDELCGALFKARGWYSELVKANMRIKAGEDHTPLYRRVIQSYGQDRQVLKALEELAECSAAIARFFAGERARPDRDLLRAELLGELADGEWCPGTTPYNGHDDDGHGEAVLYRAGKKLTGNTLDGQIWERFPEVETPQAPTLFGVSNVR